MRSNSREDLKQDLYQVLNQEAEGYKKLYELAEQKQDALVTNELEELLRITETESALLDEISEYEEKRFQLIDLLSEELEIEELTFTRLLPNLGGEKKEKFVDLREQLLQIIEDLNSLNESNRELLRQALKFNEFTLKTIVGADAGQQTYGSSGRNDISQNKSNRIINRQA